MDKLLPQVKAFCQQAFDWVRRSDVTLIPNPGVIPEGIGFPYIGIKDGDSSFHHEIMGNVREDELDLDVYIYDRLGRSDDSIVGLHEKGRDVLDELPGATLTGGVISVVPVKGIPVALLYTKKGLVIRKGLRFRFEREE